MAITNIAVAKDVKFELSLDKDSVAIGEAAQLGLSFYGTQSMPAPDIGNIDGLEIRYLGPSTMMTVINGQVSSSITHMYRILPLRVGRFQIGPFSFKLKGDSYASNIAFLEVSEERAARPVRQAPAPAEEMDLEDRIFATLDAGKASAYTNELIPVKVKLYVNRLNVSDIQLPTFDQGGFSKVEFKEPRQYRETMGGLLYDVLEFNTSIFGTRPGDYTLGPAKIKCNAIARKRVARAGSMRDDMFGDEFNDSFFDNFFTRYEKHPLELKSPEVKITVLPLPAEGRPAGFTGAVGDYQFIYRASPTKVKAGDPITVRMEINGTGNFNTVLMPRIENTAGFKVYEPQVKTEERTKAFTQVLIPESEKVTAIPGASFSYFDPGSGGYKKIVQNPIPIHVEKAKDDSPPQVVGPIAPVAPKALPQKEDLARDIIYIKESPGRWLAMDYAIYRNSISILIIILPFMLIAALSIVQERRNRFRVDTVYAGRLLAMRAAKTGLRALKAKLKSGGAGDLYGALFETLQNYLGNRLGIPPAGVTGDAAVSALGARNVSPDIPARVKRLFEACDTARFALSQFDNTKMKDDVKDAEDLIRYLERRKL